MITRAFRPALSVGAVALVTASLPVAIGAPPAAVNAAAATGCRTGADDFDGNGGTDVAIAAPHTGGDIDGDSASRGKVIVKMRMTNGVHTVRINAPESDRKGLRNFGSAVTELDLSDHTHPAAPCSGLAISSSYLDAGTRVFVVYLYRWDAATKRFTVLNKITEADVDPNLVAFGRTLAAPTMGTASPRPRRAVLYIGGSLNGEPTAGKYGAGAVARLVLTPQGTIASKQIIVPGASATAQMPLARKDAYQFSFALLGTPDPDQVIIGDPGATVGRADGAGAVVIWNRTGSSQLISENTPGVPGTAEELDGFGTSLWLSTEASLAAHAPTYLFVGAPTEGVGRVKMAGAAIQLVYDRAASPARVVGAGAKFWSQATKGVAGQPEEFDRFGSSFQSYTVRGGAPRFLVTVPEERYHDRYGTVDVLGDGRSFDQTVTPDLRGADIFFGATLSAWRNTDDRMRNDPFPAPAPGRWSHDILVSSGERDYVTWGLPGGSVRKAGAIRYGLSSSCSGITCGFGSDMTPSGGG